MSVLIWLIILLFFTATIIHTINEQKRSSEYNNYQKKCLEEELEKPMFHVEVITFDNEKFYTDKIKPQLNSHSFIDSEIMLFLKTSKVLAEDYVHKSYKVGYFQFKDGFVPIRVVKEVKVLGE